MFQEPGPFDDFHSYRFATFAELKSTDGGFYLFPLSFWLYNFLSLFDPVVGLRIFLSINIIIYVYAVRLFSKDKWLLLFSVLNYPFVFSLVRGNNEVLIAGVALIAVYYSYQKRQKISILFLALSFLLEPFPSYLTLTKIKNLHKLIFSLLLISLLLFVFFIADTSTVLEYVNSLFTFSGNHASGFGPGSSIHSTSLSTFIQTLYALKFGDFPLEDIVILDLIPRIYYFGIILFVFIWLFFRAPLAYRLLSLNCVWLLIYSSSYNYRNVHLVVCFILFYIKINKTLFDKVIMLTIVLICLPKPFFWINTPNNPVGSIESGLIDPLLILFLLIFTLISNKFSDESLGSKQTV
jgi:hypothetical protein